MMLFGVIVLALAIIIMLACYVSFRIAIVKGRQVHLTKPEEIHKNSPLYPYIDRFTAAGVWFESQTKIPMEIKSYDGLSLYGEYIPNEKSKTTILLMHGFRSSRDDFCLALKFYRSLGFNILLIDQRGHGKSEGRYITYGAKEKYDCLSWVNALIEKYGKDQKIILSGISMGASTVLMASTLDLPEQVKAIIADSGFTNGFDIVKLTAKKIFRYVPNWFIEATNFLCRIFADFDLKDDNTLIAMKTCQLPVMFIHGTADSIVPYEMTLRTYSMLKDKKEIVIAPGAEHGMGFLMEGEKCAETIKGFLDKYLD